MRNFLNVKFWTGTLQTSLGTILTRVKYSPASWDRERTMALYICIGTSKLWTPFLTPADLSLHPLALQPLRMLTRQWEVLHVSRTKPRAKIYARAAGSDRWVRLTAKQPGSYPLCFETVGEAAHVKFTKFYSKGNSVIYAKICTYQNFPLYGIRK